MVAPHASRPRPSRSRRGRNPRATPAEHRQVLRIAARIVDEVDPHRRAAVLLAGSWARGDAHQASDIDLWVVGKRGRDRILERGGHMVCVKFSTAADERREMCNPGRLDGAVPGWRNAKILRDPYGVATRLRSEARRFRWQPLRKARDAYIADLLTGLAEEVAKLLRALETGEKETASVQRNLLANRMAFLWLLSQESLWETENGLWETAGRTSGARFRSVQRTALGTDQPSWKASCEAALRLYSLTARSTLGTLRGEKRRIVLATCRRAGYPVG
ncbi:MAG: nucleotidyltransferase domain-containing protein [Thermoplasmata archaeon]